MNVINKGERGIRAREAKAGLLFDTPQGGWEDGPWLRLADANGTSGRQISSAYKNRFASLLTGAIKRSTFMTQRFTLLDADVTVHGDK